MSVPGAEQNIERYGEQVAYTVYQLGKGPRWAIRPGQLAIVDTESSSVRSISLPDGATTAILRRDEPVREVTGEHVEAYVAADGPPEHRVRRLLGGAGGSEQAGLAQTTHGFDPPGPRVDPPGCGRDPLGRAPYDVRSGSGAVALPAGRGGLASWPTAASKSATTTSWASGAASRCVEYVRMYALEKPE